MEKQEIKFCVRPYLHDCIKTIERKPKYNKTTGKHSVTYLGKSYPLDRTSAGFVVWIEEDDREKY